MADLRRLLTYHDLLGEPPCEVADDQHGRDPPAKPPRVRTLLQLAAWELEYIASYDVDMAVDVLCSPLYCPAMAPVISVSVRRRAMRVRLGIPICKPYILATLPAVFFFRSSGKLIHWLAAYRRRRPSRT